MSAEDREEFPVQVDNAAYFIPTIGFCFLGAIGAAVVTFPIGSLLPGLSDVLVLALHLAAGLGAGAWWVSRCRRVHTERKLVIDPAGVTYVKFAGRERVMRWEDIERVAEEVDRGEGTNRNLDLYLKSGGRFRIESDAFVGYDEIKTRVSRNFGGVPSQPV